MLFQKLAGIEMLPLMGKTARKILDFSFSLFSRNTRAHHDCNFDPFALICAPCEKYGAGRLLPITLS
jgi:hypothetical protein